MALIECVPNFSEGKNKSTIKAICQAIEAIDGVTLLDSDPGEATNRTVVTFVGEPKPVLEAAFQAVKTAQQRIDMSQHRGAHPRMGATDVCPIIPVSDISIEECIALAEELGQRIGSELNIPIYLYGEAAKKEERRKLPDIRQGEYEALKEKLQTPEFKPDFGPAVFNARSGATAVGVRDFLLAYNINLNTKDAQFAREIGMTIRERGRAKRDKNYEIIRDSEGKSIIIPGKLQNCQAGGWFIEEYGYAQVTMNLTNYHNVGLHHAFDVVIEEAAKAGLRVTGSELVGMVPKKAILDAGLHYLRKSNKNTGIPEEDIIHVGILSLGLNDTTPFDPQKRIIEMAISEEKKGLVNQSIEEFVTLLSTDAMAPGGGSVAALNGALSAGLSSMVANLTHGKRGYQRHNKVMEELSIKAQALMNEYLTAIDSDTDAFNSYISAIRLPKKTEAEISARAEAMESAAQEMTLVPMETLRKTRALMTLSEQVIQRGNKNALSDSAVAAIQAEASATGAFMNVMINLPTLSDNAFKEKIEDEAKSILKEVKQIRRRLEARALKAIQA